jgi:hypothetical protein
MGYLRRKNPHDSIQRAKVMSWVYWKTAKTNAIQGRIIAFFFWVVKAGNSRRFLDVQGSGRGEIGGSGL